LVTYFNNVFGEKIAKSQLDDIFKLASGILRLGNIDFEDDAKGKATVTKDSTDHAEFAAELFGLDKFSKGDLTIAKRLLSFLSYSSAL
jgi:myosin heavy subunit